MSKKLKGIQFPGSTEIYEVGEGVASTSTLGVVKPDGTTTTVDPDGTLHAGGGSSATPILEKSLNIEGELQISYDLVKDYKILNIIIGVAGGMAITLTVPVFDARNHDAPIQYLPIYQTLNYGGIMEPSTTEVITAAAYFDTMDNNSLCVNVIGKADGQSITTARLIQIFGIK